MTKIKEIIEELNKIDTTDKSEQNLSNLYDLVYKLSYLLAFSRYSHLIKPEIDHLAHEVSVEVITKILEQRRVIVKFWGQYIKILNKKYYVQLFSETRLQFMDDHEALESLSRNNSIQYSINDLIDLEDAITETYNLSQQIFKEVPIQSQEKRILLERLIFYAISVSECVLELLEPLTKKFALSIVSRIKSVIRKQQKEGLILARGSI